MPSSSSSLSTTSSVTLKIYYNSDLRRLSVDATAIDFSSLVAQITSLFEIQPNETMKFKYSDEDGDLVTIQNQGDLTEAIQVATKLQNHTLSIYVTEGKSGTTQSGLVEVNSSDEMKVEPTATKAGRFRHGHHHHHHSGHHRGHHRGHHHRDGERVEDRSDPTHSDGLGHHGCRKRGPSAKRQAEENRIAGPLTASISLNSNSNGPVSSKIIPIVDDSADVPAAVVPISEVSASGAGVHSPHSHRHGRHHGHHGHHGHHRGSHDDGSSSHRAHHHGGAHSHPHSHTHPHRHHHHGPHRHYEGESQEACTKRVAAAGRQSKADQLIATLAASISSASISEVAPVAIAAGSTVTVPATCDLSSSVSKSMSEECGVGRRHHHHHGPHRHHGSHHHHGSRHGKENENGNCTGRHHDHHHAPRERNYPPYYDGLGHHGWRKRAAAAKLQSEDDKINAATVDAANGISIPAAVPTPAAVSKVN